MEKDGCAQQILSRSLKYNTILVAEIAREACAKRSEGEG
jgi:hypothetical protein